MTSFFLLYIFCTFENGVCNDSLLTALFTICHRFVPQMNGEPSREWSWIMTLILVHQDWNLQCIMNGFGQLVHGINRINIIRYRF